MQNWEISKNCHFSQVRGDWKLQFFWFSWKPLKMKENIPTWHQEDCNVKIHSFWGKLMKIEELAKIVIFRKSAVIENIFFYFLESHWKWRNISLLNIRQLKCKNSLILWQNMENWGNSKKCHFSQVHGHLKLVFFLFFFFSGKSFENEGKHPFLISGQLKCKNLLILGQNM